MGRTTKKYGQLILLYVYEFVSAYMNMCNIPQNIGLCINNILAINTMTSAPSMSDLLEKISYLEYIISDDDTRHKFGDSLYELALNTLMDIYTEQELKDFWKDENM